MGAGVWLVGAVLLCAGEVLTLDLVLLMLAGAALAAAATALVTASLLAQLAVLAASAVVLLAVVRPVARRHLESRTALPSGKDRLQGRQALVVQHVDEGGGQVRLDGELWRARPYAGGPDLAPGSTAVVASVEGATLLVYPEELSHG